MKLVVSDHWRERRAMVPPPQHSLLLPPHSKRSVMGEHEENMFDFKSHWAYAFIGTAVAFVALMAVSVYVIIKRRRKASSPLTPDPPKQASFRCPPLAPAPETMGIISPMPQAIRIKARGLLERRGSNASLTIDLNQQDNLFPCGTPPKECSTEEYLLSAGNRMTRRQLRVSIRDMRNLQQEYLDLPLNHPGKLDLSGCSNKNRYKTILPNLHSRVLLHPSHPLPLPLPLPLPPLSPHSPRSPRSPHAHLRAPHPSSSYINANYIKGYDGEERAFIATQGPLPNTINDFWHMVWQEKTTALVMMTKLQERNRIKCEPYLPTREAQYGSIHVMVRNTIARSGYYIRELILQKDNVVREVKHFWFTGWPDQKAPVSTARFLLDMAKEVEEEREKNKRKLGPSNVGPVVVHCSAGIGRTGCFLGTCIGMQQLKEENMVDVLGIVCQLRLDRGGMIQTVEQYEFLHHVLILLERELPETPTAPLPLTSSSSSPNTSKNPSPSYDSSHSH